AAAALGGTAAAGAFVTAAFSALFAENRDIGDLGVVEAVAAGVGLEPAPFAARVRDDASLREVLANNDRLVAAGGFGTPSFVVGAGGTKADFYFGNDRLPLVEAALARAGDLRLVLPGEHGA
ncbi:MAG: DsbA family protein, partial [Gammaproteobacteria bacterium]|nr:DsbA family protein [Gammaproteobacteria bacterium]